MLYPPPETGEAGPSTLKSNSYEPFRMLDTRIEEGLRGMAEEEQQRMGDTDAKGINGTSGSLPRTRRLATRPRTYTGRAHDFKLTDRSTGFGLRTYQSFMPYDVFFLSRLQCLIC